MNRIHAATTVAPRPSRTQRPARATANAGNAAGGVSELAHSHAVPTSVGLLNRIRGKLSRIYWWLEKRIDPGTRSSQYFYAEQLRLQLRPGLRWLDLGCGRQVMPEWIPDQASLVGNAKLAIGLDCAIESLEGNTQLPDLVVGDLACAPFAANSFDVISCNMVAEHLQNPGEALRDVCRVLRTGGYFVYHTTNIRFYMVFIASLLPQRVKNTIIEFAEGRSEKDVFPTHYRMNSIDAIYEIAQLCGFRVAHCYSVNSSSTSDIILFGPFVLLTLFIRRLLQWDRLRQFRSNFIVVLEKSPSGSQ